MELKYITLVVICGVQVLYVTDSDGTPVPEFHSQAKPPKCPHGRCFIDRCKNICSCIPNTGEKLCPKKDAVLSFFMDSSDCKLPANAGNCPHGATYKEELWSDRFMCYCNDDVSQTYECFDLETNSPADATVLISWRLGVKKVQEKAIDHN
ncbi:hypothetical protein Ocin01_00565 [Orchesella cincta]|uniref:Uncharacterized protein n=1 Tax=Orchesella cincta TaxID=48709 RepID=A0A1D2NLK7_ORCCI|nr:hypothetical protein Ocin01_00565 [Orchesella cincta]